MVLRPMTDRHEPFIEDRCAVLLRLSLCGVPFLLVLRIGIVHTPLYGLVVCDFTSSWCSGLYCEGFLGGTAPH